MCTVDYVDGDETTSWDMSSHLARATVFEEFAPFLGRIGHPGQEVGLVCPLLDIAQYVESSQRCCRRHLWPTDLCKFAPPACVQASVSSAVQKSNSMNSAVACLSGCY